MKIEAIADKLAEIQEVTWDSETAHQLEKRLWFDVLTAIAEGASDAQELARKAIETQEIEFHRWYA